MRIEDRAMITIETARTAPGLRLYAIGDLHGDAAALRRLRAAIARDLARRPTADWRVLFLGDYVDRGPEAYEVLETLSKLGPEARSYCLSGNHDACLAALLVDAETPSFYPWLEDGGIATLASYGIEAVSPLDFPNAAARADLRAWLIDAMPPEHVGFLMGLPHGVRFGDYFFSHGGIRPGVPLSEQSAGDLMWGPGFLSATAPHEAIVVHGHSPVDQVEVHPNRIAIETSRSGSPSCLMLEGEEQYLLTEDGPCLLLPALRSVAAAA
ncbi:MAG: metallophosphoesterase [Pseudomonadota bacterium]